METIKKIEITYNDEFAQIETVIYYTKDGQELTAINRSIGFPDLNLLVQNLVSPLHTRWIVEEPANENDKGKD
jgi:hypothetical protein